MTNNVKNVIRSICRSYT